MEYVEKKLSEIRPYGNNPRTNDGAVDDVAESIRQCGYLAPIIVDEDGVILAGHTRYKALKKLGRDSCAVVVVSGLAEAQKRKYRLYDNKAGELSGWDQKKLREELSGVDFRGYDFGQPEACAMDGKDAGGMKKQMKTCPCCGEVFEA